MTELHKVCIPLLRDESDRGNRVKSWTMYQYTGYSCGSVQVGSRGDGEIARLSGEQASTNWTMLLPFASNCSRVDLQLTIFFPKESKLIMKHLWRAVRRHKPKHGKPPCATLIESTDGSWTIYSGKRTSDLMGRIYDKGRETKSTLLDGCIRFEVEMKGDAAVQVSREIYTAVDRPAAIASRVSAFFVDRGVPPCFFDSLPQAHLLSASLRSRRPVADDVRSLEWLGKFVQPSVERLIMRGHHDAVLAALGLGPHGPSQENNGGG